MNWTLIIVTLASIVYISLALLGAYHLPGFLLRSERKDQMQKASNKEKVWAYLRVLGIVFLIAAVFGYMKGEDGLSYSFIAFVSLGLPAYFSINGYFLKNDKLTIEERKSEQTKNYSEKAEASKMHIE